MGSSALTMSVPATGPDLASDGTETALFHGRGADTSVAVQATTDGLRALVHIDTPLAPERFDFKIGGDVAQLRLTKGGGVEAMNRTGAALAEAPAPWATDGNGRPVPTHYEIQGTTLTQVVEHRGGRFAYGIVADPSFFWWAKNIVKCTVGIAGTLSAAGAVTKIAKLKKFLSESRALKVVVDRAGGITSSSRRFSRSSSPGDT